jgi:hypothetical protein
VRQTNRRKRRKSQIPKKKRNPRMIKRKKRRRPRKGINLRIRKVNISQKSNIKKAEQNSFPHSLYH